MFIVSKKYITLCVQYKHSEEAQGLWYISTVQVKSQVTWQCSQFEYSLKYKFTPRPTGQPFTNTVTGYSRNNIVKTNKYRIKTLMMAVLGLLFCARLVVVQHNHDVCFYINLHFKVSFYATTIKCNILYYLL